MRCVLCIGSTTESTPLAPRKRLPLRILVVDDDETDRLAVRRCLRQPVSRCRRRSGSAAEALEQIGIAAYDCVLLDYYLPGVARAATREASGAAPDLPVVIFTDGATKISPLS